MKLTLKDTNILKGVALILLLIHHLFWRNTELYDDINLFSHYNLFQSFGVISKCCVALFVFLSGYGLTCKYKEYEFKKKEKLLDFYSHRYLKLFFNYWLIFLLFIPVSVLSLGPSLSDTYGNNFFLRLIMDLFGISGLLNYPFYNTTWWFLSCIIGLYLLYPFLLRLLKKGYFFMLLTGSLIMSILPIDYPTKVVWLYMPVFLCGIIFEIESFPRFSCLGGAFLLVMLCGVRLVAYYGMLLDILIAVFIILIYAYIKIPEGIENVLCYIGKRSMLIFLFHTFIFNIWFKEFIFSSRNPLIIFLLLLSFTIVLSEIVILIKKLICFDLVLKQIELHFCH